MRAIGILFISAVAFVEINAEDSAAILLRDFDGDGVEERIVSSASNNEIQRRNPDSGEWESADFALPDGVTVLDENGHDAGLRFVDLNSDGFDDVFFSNTKEYSIHLWTKNVQPHLGWTRGWTQFVKSGQRKGDPNEPPNLLEADAHIEGDQLVIVRKVDADGSTSTQKIALVDLIAFEISAGKPPEEALRTFQLRPGFKIELVAAEPVVVDPVAFDWGADGSFWVVEMRDYPSGMDGRGAPGGVVKKILDTDGDGRYDKAIPFIESIGFPTSVMPWRDGLLVAAAPSIVFAVDLDGDGIADKKEILLTGFNPGNQQHRVNGFELGLDGWVYVANGDSGGHVKSAKTGTIIDIRGRDFRFKPDSGELETVSAQTQYGRRRDDWGNWFGNNNPTWLWHVTLPEHYLRRNSKLAVRSVKKVLANYDDPTRVFPISPEVVRPNQPWSINHVTSACSPTPYRDTLFGPEFATSVFISEPVHNAIHREVLEQDGGTFSSHRATGEETSEFLASTDNWFRPTTTKVGPDGALYVADMYRLSIEHPEWISPEMQARINVRAGADRGRIYRIVPEEVNLRPIPDLAELNNRQLVRAMDSPNGWQRDTVQRLLLEGDAGSATAELAWLLQPNRLPQVRLQALSTMGMFGTLDQHHLVRALNDPNPFVRCEALRQSEAFAGNAGKLFKEVTSLADDSDAHVRLQVAFSLGEWPFQETRRTLEKLSAEVGDDELLRIAIMSSLPPDSELFQLLNRSDTRVNIPSVVVKLEPSSPDREKVIAAYDGVENLKGDPERGREQFELLCATCHRFDGEGSEVGPDLDMVSAKGVEWLVAAILDPSQAVEARYRPWTIELNSGEEVSGIITAEAANNLVLRVAGGEDRPVLRSEIKSIDQQILSLMPSGFESALTPQGMADLLAWLRKR